MKDLRRKCTLIMSLSLALPLYNNTAYAADDNADTKKNIEMLAESEEFSGAVSESETDAGPENKLETLFHKIQSNVVLFTIKVRNNWDSKTAAIAGLSITTALFFTLYMRSHSRTIDKTTIADLQKRLSDEQNQKEVFLGLCMKQRHDLDHEKNVSRQAHDRAARDKSSLEEERSKSAVHLSEQQARVTSLEQQNEQLRNRAVEIETQSKSRLHDYAQRLNGIIEKADKIAIPIPDGDEIAYRQHEEVVNSLKAEQKKLAQEPQPQSKGLFARLFR